MATRFVDPLSGFRVPQSAVGGIGGSAVPSAILAGPVSEGVGTIADAIKELARTRLEERGRASDRDQAWRMLLEQIAANKENAASTERTAKYGIDIQRDIAEMNRDLAVKQAETNAAQFRERMDLEKLAPWNQYMTAVQSSLASASMGEIARSREAGEAEAQATIGLDTRGLESLASLWPTAAAEFDTPNAILENLKKIGKGFVHMDADLGLKHEDVDSYFMNRFDEIYSQALRGGATEEQAGRMIGALLGRAMTSAESDVLGSKYVANAAWPSFLPSLQLKLYSARVWTKGALGKVYEKYSQKPGFTLGGNYDPIRAAQEAKLAGPKNLDAIKAKQESRARSGIQQIQEALGVPGGLMLNAPPSGALLRPGGMPSRSGTSILPPNQPDTGGVETSDFNPYWMEDSKFVPGSGPSSAVGNNAVLNYILQELELAHA